MSDEVTELTARHTYGTWRAQRGWKPLHVTKAEGCYFWDASGKRWLDMSAQLVCSNLGHQNPAVVEAICAQARELAFIGPAYACDVRAKLSVKMLEVVPKGIDKFFFTTSGTEANEAAIKIARLYTGKHKILARYTSYHGPPPARSPPPATSAAGSWSPPARSPAWSSAPGQLLPLPARAGAPDVQHGLRRLPGLHDRPRGERGRGHDRAHRRHNGVLVPPKDYLPRLAEICKKRGVLLIADEVMTGWGRTGKCSPSSTGA